MLFQLGILPFFTTQFLVLVVCNNGGSESIYHASDLMQCLHRYTEWGRIETAFFIRTFFVLNDEQQPLHFAIHGLMLQEKALIVLFDVNVSTQVDRRAFIVQHSLNEQLPFFCGNYQKGCPNMVIVMCPLHSTWYHEHCNYSEF